MKFIGRIVKFFFKFGFVYIVNFIALILLECYICACYRVEQQSLLGGFVKFILDYENMSVVGFFRACSNFDSYAAIIWFRIMLFDDYNRHAYLWGYGGFFLMWFIAGTMLFIIYVNVVDAYVADSYEHLTDIRYEALDQRFYAPKRLFYELCHRFVWNRYWSIPLDDLYKFFKFSVVPFVRVYNYIIELEIVKEFLVFAAWFGGDPRVHLGFLIFTIFCIVTILLFCVVLLLVGYCYVVYCVVLASIFSFRFFLVELVHYLDNTTDVSLYAWLKYQYELKREIFVSWFMGASASFIRGVKNYLDRSFFSFCVFRATYLSTSRFLVIRAYLRWKRLEFRHLKRLWDILVFHKHWLSYYRNVDLLIDRQAAFYKAFWAKYYYVYYTPYYIIAAGGVLWYKLFEVFYKIWMFIYKNLADFIDRHSTALFLLTVYLMFGLTVYWSDSLLLFWQRSILTSPLTSHDSGVWVTDSPEHHVLWEFFHPFTYSIFNQLHRALKFPLFSDPFLFTIYRPRKFWGRGRIRRLYLEYMSLVYDDDIMRMEMSMDYWPVLSGTLFFSDEAEVEHFVFATVVFLWFSKTFWFFFLFFFLVASLLVVPGLKNYTLTAIGFLFVWKLFSAAYGLHFGPFNPIATNMITFFTRTYLHSRPYYFYEDVEIDNLGVSPIPEFIDHWLYTKPQHILATAGHWMLIYPPFDGHFYGHILHGRILKSYRWYQWNTMDTKTSFFWMKKLFFPFFPRVQGYMLMRTFPEKYAFVTEIPHLNIYWRAFGTHRLYNPWITPIPEIYQNFPNDYDERPPIPEDAIYEERLIARRKLNILLKKQAESK